MPDGFLGNFDELNGSSFFVGFKEMAGEIDGSRRRTRMIVVVGFQMG